LRYCTTTQTHLLPLAEDLLASVSGGTHEYQQVVVRIMW